MEIDTVKNIATIAAPLTKVVFDTFLKPKLDEIKKSWKRDENIIDHAFEDKFLEYLNETYEKNAILNTVAFKRRKILLDDVYVPLTIQYQNNHDKRGSILIDQYSDVVFKESSKILITDTAGMGKSTMSKKLLLSCIDKNEGVPMLIELRRLSKNKDVIQEILEQLNPINEEIDKQFVLDLIKRGDFIFFFDGFDEISITDRAHVTTEIQKFISKARSNKFVLTSRPEEALSSFGDFFKYQIKPLIPDEAYELIKRYDISNKIAPLLISKIQEKDNFSNIEEYLTTPLLVSLLFTAFEHKQSIPFKKHIFYRQVFDALFESHDLSKGDSFEREKHSKLGSDEFHRVLRTFGYFCLKQENKIEFTRDELGIIVTESLDYVGENNVKSSDFIKDLLITVPIFSKDGMYYKWSHKSLQEYFAAQFIFIDSKEIQKDILKHIAFHKNNMSYINVLDLYQSMDPLGFESVITLSLLTKFIDYLDNSYKNFDGKEKLMRQELTFGYDIYLIRIRFDLKTKENHPSEVFKILKNQFKIKYPRMSIGINVTESEDDISCIKIPEIKKPEQNLIEYHNNLGYDFIKQIDITSVSEKIDLKLIKRKPYHVTDRKNALLNSETNFSKVNDLIKIHLRKRSFLTVDKDKALEQIDRIESRSKKASNNSLLNF
ncbi:NACHT domain-containing protein [Maribacter algicola]|uniref:NACHT domain-containing protein n=1 Tax=Meishania litoralis TaxID=3434685 RepID=A0ACC7LF25_9FLAO